MGAVVRYLTHPQVTIDPAVPVPEWTLSEVGRARAEAFAAHPCLRDTARIVASGEVKAAETAEIIARTLGLAVEVREAMHENDRSATGFLPADAFEAVADRFFAAPEESVRGWERAIDAQARIVDEVDAVLKGHGGDDLLFVGHGAVGTLLLCHIAGLAIAREHDQPAGGGNYFAFAMGDRRLLHGWRRTAMSTH